MAQEDGARLKQGSGQRPRGPMIKAQRRSVDELRTERLEILAQRLNGLLASSEVGELPFPEKGTNAGPMTSGTAESLLGKVRSGASRAIDGVRGRAPPVTRDLDWTVDHIEMEMETMASIVAKAYALAERAEADTGLRNMLTVSGKDLALGAEFTKPWELLRKAAARVLNQPRLAYLQIKEARELMQIEIEISEALRSIDETREKVQGYCPSDQEMSLMVGLRQDLLHGRYREARENVAKLTKVVEDVATNSLLDQVEVSFVTDQGVQGEGTEVGVVIKNEARTPVKLMTLDYSSTVGFVEPTMIKEALLGTGESSCHEFYFTPNRPGDLDILVRARFIVEGTALETVRHLNFHAEPAPVAYAFQTPQVQSSPKSDFRLRVRAINGERVLAVDELLEHGAPPSQWVKAMELARREGALLDLASSKTITVKKEDGTDAEQKKEMGTPDSLPGYVNMWKAAFCIEPGKDVEKWRDWLRGGPFLEDEIAKRAFALLFELSISPQGRLELHNDQGVLASTAGYVRDALFCLVGMTINNPEYRSYATRMDEFYQKKDETMGWETQIAMEDGRIVTVTLREEIVLVPAGNRVERFIFHLERKA